jgi:hypothetical protein
MMALLDFYRSSAPEIPATFVQTDAVSFYMALPRRL